MAGSPCGDPPPTVVGKRAKSSTEGMILGIAALTVMAGMSAYAVYQLAKELAGGPRRRQAWDA